MKEDDGWGPTSGSPPWIDARGRGVPLPSKKGRDMFPLPLPAEVPASYSDQRGILHRGEIGRGDWFRLLERLCSHSTG